MALAVALGVTAGLAPAEAGAVSSSALRLLGHDQAIQSTVRLLALEGVPVVAEGSGLAVSTDEPVKKNAATERQPRAARSGQARTGAGDTRGDRCTGSFNQGESDEFKGPYPLCPP